MSFDTMNMTGTLCYLYSVLSSCCSVGRSPPMAYLFDPVGQDVSAGCAEVDVELHDTGHHDCCHYQHDKQQVSAR